MSDKKLLRLADVVKLTGLKKKTLLKDVGKGLKATGRNKFKESDVRKYMAKRSAKSAPKAPPKKPASKKQASSGTQERS